MLHRKRSFASQIICVFAASLGQELVEKAGIEASRAQLPPYAVKRGFAAATHRLPLGIQRQAKNSPLRLCESQTKWARKQLQLCRTKGPTTNRAKRGGMPR